MQAFAKAQMERMIHNDATAKSKVAYWIVSHNQNLVTANLALNKHRDELRKRNGSNAWNDHKWEEKISNLKAEHKSQMKKKEEVLSETTLQSWLDKNGVNEVGDKQIFICK